MCYIWNGFAKRAAPVPHANRALGVARSHAPHAAVVRPPAHGRVRRYRHHGPRGRGPTQRESLRVGSAHVARREPKRRGGGRGARGQGDPDLRLSTEEGPSPRRRRDTSDGGRAVPDQALARWETDAGGDAPLSLGRSPGDLTIRCEPLTELGADHRSLATITREGRVGQFLFQQGAAYQ